MVKPRDAHSLTNHHRNHDAAARHWLAPVGRRRNPDRKGRMMERAIYNPHNAPVDDLPIIFGFNNGGYPGFYDAQLIAQDGVFLGSHLCSNESFMLGDLGILPGRRADRHETFKRHYPAGYRMEFVSYADAGEHSGLQAAFAANEAARKGGAA